MSMVIRMNGVTIQEPLKESKVESRWSGDLEDSRKGFVNTMTNLLVPTILTAKLAVTPSGAVYAASENANRIRDGFAELLDVFTAIAEPILWCYALTACILMATKNKNNGWERLKQVGYAYAAIALLPTFFAFLRYIAELIKGAVSF